MNYRTQAIILTILVFICLTLPISGLAEPITVTSTGPAHIEFYSKTQGQCYVEVGTTPSETPDEFYFGQGNLSITGYADAKTDYDGAIANKTVYANGNIQLKFSDQTLNLNIQSSNETVAYFLSDNYGSKYNDNYAIGCDFSKETTPKEIHLVLTGNTTDRFGTKAFSGTLVFYVDEETTFEDSNQAMTAIIYNGDNTVLASIIWVQEDTAVPWGFTLNEAEMFQHSVDFYAISPSLKIVTNAAGNCVYSQFPSEFDDYSEMPQLQHGNGSLIFNAMTLNEANVEQFSEEYYGFDSGVYGIGSINLSMQNNQSINVNIYTNGSGAGGMFLREGNQSIFLIGNVYQSSGTLAFNGTQQNATGTYNIKGTFEIYSIEVQQENSTSTMYVVETILMNENEYPIAISIWSQGDYPEFSEENNIDLLAADSFERSVDYCPSACTTITSDNNTTIIADHTTATGAKISLNGTIIPTGTIFNITTVNYGSTQPISVTNPPTQGATYFETRIMQANGSALNGVTAKISLTDLSFNTSSAISYWNGTTWVKAVNQQFTAPNTISGEILASELTDTTVMVDYSAPTSTPTPTPTPTTTPSPSPSTSPSPSSSPSPTTTPTATASPSTSPENVIPEFGVFAVLGLMALLTFFAAIVRLRGGKRTVNFAPQI